MLADRDSPASRGPVSPLQEPEELPMSVPVRFVGGPADGEATDLMVDLDIVELVEDRRGRVFEVRTQRPVERIDQRVLYRRSIVDPAVYVFQP